MTELEKAQLAELAERAWRCAPEKFCEFGLETFKGFSFMHLPKGLSMVRNRDLINLLRQWDNMKEKQDMSKAEAPKAEVPKAEAPKAEIPDLETEIKKGFGLVENGYYKIGDFTVFHKSYADNVAVLATVLVLVVGFIAGVSLTALFNWIF